MKHHETTTNVDINFVREIIYNIKNINPYDALKAMHTFLNSSSNEQEKEDLYKKFIIAFSKLCSQHFSGVIHGCVSGAQQDKLQGKVIKGFLRKIVNSPIFIDTIRNYKIQNNSLLSLDVDLLAKLFDNDTIIALLQCRLSKSDFLILGCHPALLSRIDLQKRWIQYYVESSDMPFYIKRWYVTDQAINKLSRDFQVLFALKFAVYFVPHRRNKFAFSLDTIKRFLLSEIVIDGKKRYIEYALNRIQNIQTKYSHYLTQQT